MIGSLASHRRWRLLAVVAPFNVLAGIVQERVGVTEDTLPLWVSTAFGCLVVGILTVRRSGLRPVVVPWLVATAGVLVVVALHSAAGFNWLTGLAQLRIRYYQGIASERPFSYFVYANVAAWLISCSPLLAVGATRAVAALTSARRNPPNQDRLVALIALSGVLVALLADDTLDCVC